MIKKLHLNCRGTGAIPSWGTKIPPAPQGGQNNRKKNLFHDRKISCLFMLLLATKSAQMFFLMHHTHLKLNQCYR